MANAVVKSYSSFSVNEGLLAKVVDAVQAGERDARRYGKVKSFEIFYTGHRVNLVLGRIMIVPAKIADSIDDFPTALLYGTMVKELSGETISDIFTHKMGESEYDEYNDKDLKAIKEKLFTDAEGNLRSLIMFLPTWAAPRDYVVFKMVHDEVRLAMLIRHLIYGAYFDPALSSAFEQLSTEVLTERLDVTDITPKMNFPFLAENVLKQYPDLQPGDKIASKRLPKLLLNVHTAAKELQAELLEPGEEAVLNKLTEEITSKVDHEISTAEEVQKQASGENPLEGMKIASGQRENMVRDWVIAHKGAVPPRLFLDAKTSRVSTTRPDHPLHYSYSQPRIAALVEAGYPGQAKEAAVDTADDQHLASTDDSGAETGLRRQPDYGESDSYTSVANRMAEKGASFKTAGSMTWGIYFDGGGFQWTIFEAGMGKPKIVAKGTAATQEEADATIEQHVQGKAMPPQPFNNRLASFAKKTASAISDLVLGYVQAHGGVVPQTLFVNLDKKYCAPERPDFGYIYVSKAETERMQREKSAPAAPANTGRAWGYAGNTASTKTAAVKKVATPVTVMERSGSQLIRTGAVITAKSPTGYTETVKVIGTKIKWAMPNRFAIAFRQTAETLLRNPRFASTLKVADVPQTFEDIWGEKMDDMGPAPSVEINEAPISPSVPASSEAPAEHTAPAATEEKPAGKKEDGTDEDPKPPTEGGDKPAAEKSGEGGEEKPAEGEKKEWQKPWEKEAGAVGQHCGGKLCNSTIPGGCKCRCEKCIMFAKDKTASSRLDKLKARRPDLVKNGFFDTKIGNCDRCARPVVAAHGSEVGPGFFLHAACQLVGKKQAANGLIAYQVIAKYYPDVLRKVASREFIDAAIAELRAKGSLHSQTLELPDMAPNEQQAVLELARRLETQDQGRRYAAFNMFIPGQVAEEFAPDVLHETVDYPSDSYSPMISDVGPQADGAYVSTSPAGGLGIGQDGKPQVLDGAPLRKENDIRGYMFDQEFYQQYDGIDGTGMRAASCLAGLKKTADANEFKAQFADFLKKAMGEVAAAFMAGFKVTMRPMMNKVPGVGEINLQTIEQPTLQQMNAYNVPNVSSRVKFLVSKMNDSDIKDAINDGYAQASVWNGDEKGGYNYEVFVRPETIDPETLILTYSFVVGTKGL